MAEDGSRRRLSPAGMIGGLIALVVLVLVVVSLAGGGDDDDSGSANAPASNAAASGDAGRAETLVLGQFRPATGKIGNPYVQASDALISDGVHELVFEALFYTNYQSGETEPWLATDFEYGDGDKTVTLTLRDDVTWNDGKPFSADDVVFTLDQIKKAKAPYRAANIQAAVKSAKAVSPTQVEITLKAPNPRFVQSELSSYVYTANFIPMPKHIFQGKKFDTFAFYDLAKGWPVGTGPYTLTELDASSSTLTRNDDWWAAKAGVEELPAPARVVYTTPGPEDSAVSGLETNKLDYVGQSVPTVAGFIAARKENSNLINWDGDLGWLDPCPFSLTINTKNAPWDDPDMRWGLNAAIDKEQFSQLFNTPGEPTPARSSYPEYPQLTELLDANQDLFDTYPTLQHDVAKSDEVFAGKGYTKEDGVWTKDGKPLTLKLNLFNPAALGPVWGDAAQLLTQQFKAAGIKVDLQPGDFNLVASNRAEGKFDAQSWFECGSVTDPWATLNRYTDAPGNDNAGKWSNAEYEKIVAQIGELPPGDEQIPELFEQAMDIWLGELPVIPLVQRPTPIVMNQTYWKNWPTAQNAYTDPAPWGMNFHQVITQLESAGTASDMTLDYALRRIGFFFLVVWITITVMFFLVHLAPGDPITDQVTRMQASGQSLAAGPELIQEYKEQFGLDKPVYEQYVDYVVQLAQGNLGYSVTNFPTNVTTLIGDALPWTLGLLLTAMAISWVVGSLLGGLLAWRSTPALARGLMSTVMLFAAIPYYLLALFLLYVFAYKLQWLPTGGSRDPLGSSGGTFGSIVDVIEHGLLPALSIVLAFVGFWMLGMRSMMVSVLGSDYLQLAEAKGLPERRIFLRYGMRNAILPQVTSLAIYMGYMVAGSILVEVLFAYPGLGKILVAAVDSRDYPVIEGVVLMMVVATAGALLIIDLIYPVIDPRIRYGRD